MTVGRFLTLAVVGDIGLDLVSCEKVADDIYYVEGSCVEKIDLGNNKASFARILRYDESTEVCAYSMLKLEADGSVVDGKADQCIRSYRFFAIFLENIEDNIIYKDGISASEKEQTKKIFLDIIKNSEFTK